MPLLEIHWNPDPLYRELTAIAYDQVPFALSRTINEAAKTFQRLEQKGISSRFILRHGQWILNGVYIGRFSTKRDVPMSVTVEIDQTRELLWKFEDGDPKTARGENLAIPIAARPAKYLLVPDELRPKKLDFQMHTTRSGAEQWKGDLRTFIITMPDGRKAIMQRTGPGRRDTQLLFTLKPSAPTPAILEFQSTAEGSIVDAIERNFPIFFDEAVRTKRT